MSPAQRSGAAVPYHLTEWLLQHPGPPRRIFPVPYWWGDYLLWRLPDADKVYWYSQPEGFDLRTWRPDGEILTREPFSAEGTGLLHRNRLTTLVIDPASVSDRNEQVEGALPEAWEVLHDEGISDSGLPKRGVIVAQRVDPFMVYLDTAQACVDVLGMTPRAGSGSVVASLPWVWPRRRR
jgi:hypothetical protein